MSYERLTEKCTIGDKYYIKHCETVDCDGVCTMCDYDHDVINRLADLEDKIEQGTLMELPCKVGDKFYYIDEFRSYRKVVVEAQAYEICINKLYGFVIYDFGDKKHLVEDIFFTKEEAEARLKELKGE